MRLFQVQRLMLKGFQNIRTLEHKEKPYLTSALESFLYLLPQTVCVCVSPHMHLVSYAQSFPNNFLQQIGLKAIP